MKNLICSVICLTAMLLVGSSLMAEEFISTEKGGLWENPSTWVNNKVPQKNDDVQINGNVIVNSQIECKNINIQENKKLEFSNQKVFAKSVVNEIVYVKGYLSIGENCELVVLKNLKRDESGKSEISNLGNLIIGNLKNN